MNEKSTKLCHRVALLSAGRIQLRCPPGCRPRKHAITYLNTDGSAASSPTRVSSYLRADSWKVSPIWLQLTTLILQAKHFNATFRVFRFDWSKIYSMFWWLIACFARNCRRCDTRIWSWIMCLRRTLHWNLQSSASLILRPAHFLFCLVTSRQNIFPNISQVFPKDCGGNVWLTVGKPLRRYQIFWGMVWDSMLGTGRETLDFGDTLGSSGEAFEHFWDQVVSTDV